MATPSLSRETLLRLVSGYPLVSVVLAAHFLIAATSVRKKSSTYDEVVHVSSGYSCWVHNDYGLSPTSGVLPQRWLTLPLLTMDLNFPQDKTLWKESDVWQVGYRFFFECGNDADAILWRARCMNALLSVGLGFLVYAWSRRLFGPGGGMLSLLLYTIDPTILANGSLATTDLVSAAFFTASVGCLWKLFHKVSLGNVVCTGLALAGLSLSKMSVGLVVPMAVALLVIRLVGGRPLAVVWRKERVVNRRLAQAGVLLAIMVLQMILVVAMIWTFHGFRYSAYHRPLVGDECFPWKDMSSDTGGVGQVILFARDHRLLPESYLFGMLGAYHGAQRRVGFLNGQYRDTGWWYFFPYTFLVKTPLPAFLILILAGTGSVLSWRQARASSAHTIRQAAWEALYITAPLWILLAVYWATAIRCNLNIGHRHLLPTYPATFILAGAGVHWFARRDRLGRLAAAVVLGCMFGVAADCYAIYPHYLAYFNALAGGPRNAYKHLVGSSLDWGQDLPGLKQWLKERDLDRQTEVPVYLAYTGTSSPAYYRIHATDISLWRRSPDSALRLIPLDEGVYCIGATRLQHDSLSYLNFSNGWPGQWCAEDERIYRKVLKTMAHFEAADSATRRETIQSTGVHFWDEIYGLCEKLRISRLYAYLRQREPNDNVGYSILIYRLTADDIKRALLGPPAGLDPSLGPVEDCAQPDQPDLNDLAACNDRAWMLATSPDASIRDGAKAIALARRAVELSGGQEPLAFDTLAAAYAEAGRFPEAVETARKALELATQQDKPALVEPTKARLMRYEAGTPFRERPPPSLPLSPLP